jgi:hypothetical protein
MATLTSRLPNATYGNLLLIDNSNAGIDGTLRYVQDGEGTNSTLQLSSAGVNIVSGFTYNGNAISIAGALTFSGAYAFTATLTAATSVTFPTSGTLISTAPGTSGNVLTSNGSAWVSQAISADFGGSTAIITNASSNSNWSTSAGYINIGTSGASGNTSTAPGSPIVSTGTVSHLYVNLSASDATDTLTVTLQVNGVDSTLTCSVSPTATTANDTTHTVAVTAGDLLRFKIASDGTQTTGVAAGVKFIVS